MQRNAFLTSAAVAGGLIAAATPARAAAPQTARWTAQRWALDDIIETVGIDWDQGHTSGFAAACGPDSAPDIAALRARVKKFADISPASEAAGRRREGIAQAAESAGNLITARENYYMATVFYAFAQWPIYEINDRFVALNDKKHAMYAKYVQYADHHVESVSIPFKATPGLPAVFHLPAGYTPGTRLPAVVAIPGMDGFKESRVPLYGDRWLNRGIAVLSVEGPGEWECPLRGIHVSVENWEAAGPAMYAWLAARPEIDPHKIAIIGTSFGSFFNTIAITAEPRYAACAVQGTVYEPGCHSIFEEASPTFKERFMFMSGYTDEAAFDRFAKTLSLEGRAARVGCPYLCLSGEADELSPSHYADWLFGGMHVPRTLVVYADSRHSLAGPSVNLGPQPGPLLSDWVAARFAGKPLASERWYVDSGGRVTKTSYA